MGSETSKLQPPDEFGQSGNQFQIVSPVSDLSCPSDIHRINRLRNLHRAPPNPDRRLSKTVTRSLSNINHAGGVPAPARFYFPTQETEKAIDLAERRASQFPQGDEEKENRQDKLLQKSKKVSKKVLKKTQKALKKTHEIFQGCFNDEHAAQMEAAQRAEENKHRSEENKHHPTLGIAHKVPSQKGKNMNHLNTKAVYKAMEDPSVTPLALKNERPTHVGYHVPSTQKKPYSDARPLLDSSNKDDDSFKHPALHEADDYFSRLSTGSSETSPFFDNKAMNKAMPSAAAQEDLYSPVSNLFEDDEAIDASLESNFPRRAQRDPNSKASTKAKEQQRFLSPSYQNAIGTIAETPGYYAEDEDEDIDPSVSDNMNEMHVKTAEELVDEITAKANRALATIAEKPDDEYSNASASQSKGKNTKSAFRPRRASQTNVSLSSHNAADRKVSKLESLFRPVLPAWSADDAQSTESYDRYEIRVTESAPDVLEGKRHSSVSREMTALEKKLGGLGRMSMLSIDSQASTAMTNSMLTKQAQNNGEFLFSEDDNHVKMLNGKGHNDVASINTLGSRNRLSNRPAAKALVIKEKIHSLPRDDYVGDVERRSRFSLLDAVSASVGLAPKESIDVPSIESGMSDITERRYSEQGISSLKTVDLSASKNNLESIPDAQIDVSEIQTKPSDLTEDTVPYEGRASSGSSHHVPETIPEDDENPEIVSGEPQQVHWSYSIKEGGDSAVTPHFGKDVKNTTKSPYLRFENAKSKFGANNGALIKKETAIVKKETAIVKKKDVPHRSPRSNKVKPGIKLRPLQTGGSVANKIQALNQRVVEAKIDRKMHRWTKSNPRKYGVVESNAVRTRAIVQYKTDVIGLDKFNYMSAAKFNSLPIDDDDETSVGSSAAASRQSKKSVTFADMQPSSLLQAPSQRNNATEFEDEEADDVSKLTLDSHYMPKTYSTGTRVSESTYSTSSSGVTNIKKQIFRGSAASSESTIKSLASNGASTTMSSILEKENVNYSQFRAGAKTVKPTELSNITKDHLHLSPVPAQKWRSLAAAAQTRDSQKKPVNTGTSHPGLALKNRNALAAYGY